MIIGTASVLRQYHADAKRGTKCQYWHKSLFTTGVLSYRRPVIQNRNLLFIFSYNSYFRTDFEFLFLEILSVKFLSEFSIAILYFLLQSNNT